MRVFSQKKPDWLNSYNNHIKIQLKELNNLALSNAKENLMSNWFPLLKKIKRLCKDDPVDILYLITNLGSRERKLISESNSI